MNGLAPLPSPIQPSVSLSADKKIIIVNFDGYNIYEVKSAKGDLPEEVMEALEKLFKKNISDTEFQQNIENTAKKQDIFTCRVDLKEKKCVFYENTQTKSEYSWRDSAEKTRTAASSALPQASHSVPVTISPLLSPKLEVHTYVPPVGITNPNIACYRIASIQSLLACRSFRPLLEQKIEAGKDKEQREGIRLALLNLLKMLENQHADPAKLSGAEMHLNHLIEAYAKKQESLLTAVERNNPNNLQLDANDFVEFLLTDVLSQPNIYEKTVSGTALYPDSKKSTSVINHPMVPPPATSVLSINPAGMSGPTLTEMIDQHFHEYVIGEKLKLGTSEMQGYEQRIRITGSPKPLLTLRVERSGWNVDQQINQINKTSLSIPGNYLVDFSTAYGHPERTNMYAIASFILRTSLEGYANQSGHFISYVKKGNQWFECNDAVVKPLSEEDIRKIIPHAYMFFLESTEAKKAHNSADDID